MRSGPLHVVHLFSETANGFLLRLWLDVLRRFDQREFRFSIVLPAAPTRLSSGLIQPQSGEPGVDEMPALGNLKHPVYSLRALISLRSRFSGEPVHVVHSHFPGAAILANRLRGTFSRAAHVASLYSFAGPWRTEDPPSLSFRALRRSARRVERIVCLSSEEEHRVLNLDIGKKYQTTILQLAVPTTEGSRPNNDFLAEDLDLPAGRKWIGVLLPSSSRKELRNILMDLAPLAETGTDHHLACVVPTLRLGDVRSLLVRLRLGDRFHVPGDLQCWETLVPHLAVAVFPLGCLTSLTAALLTLGVPRPLWAPAGLPWMHLLPPPGQSPVHLGQAYRMKEEISDILESSEENPPVPAEARSDSVAEQLETVYRDVLAERLGAGR
jgi:hypothetical protein